LLEAACNAKLISTNLKEEIFLEVEVSIFQASLKYLWKQMIRKNPLGLNVLIETI